MKTRRQLYRYDHFGRALRVGPIRAFFLRLLGLAH